jgi:DNA-binding transcriptional regulator YdaS (Cro superfamily)
MHNVMHGYRPCSPELAALIDSNSKGIVGRHELRPNDWREIWPELSKRKSLKEAA